jgi:hypothetical protein
MPEAGEFFAHGLKLFLLLPILTKTGSLRQITESRNLGNGVSENRTELEKVHGPRFPSKRFAGQAADENGDAMPQLPGDGA